MTDEQIYEHHSKNPGEFLNGFICGVFATLLLGLVVYLSFLPQ